MNRLVAKSGICIALCSFILLFFSCVSIDERRQKYVDRVIVAHQDTIETKDINQAIDAYRIALLEYPEDPRLLYNLGYMLDQVGDIGKSVQTFKILTDLYPNNVTYAYAYAKVLLKHDAREHAIEQLSRVFEMDPYNEEAMLLLVQELIDSNQIARAKGIALKLYDQKSFSHQLFVLLAEIEQSLGNAEGQATYTILSQLYEK